MRLLLFLLIALLATPVFSAEPDEKLHNLCLYPTVRVRSTVASAGGTGFVVRSVKIGNEFHNVILTCHHVVRSPMIVEVPKYKNWSSHMGYSIYPCTTYLTNQKSDLAILLCVSKTALPTVELGLDEKMYIGTEIFKIGCGLGDEARLDYGKVTSMNQKIANDPLLHIRMNATTMFGDSGGPVFHNYKLVGVTRAVRNFQHGLLQLPESNISYMVPISELKSWNQVANNSLEFVYNSEKELPTIPFYRLWMGDFKIPGEQ